MKKIDIALVFLGTLFIAFSYGLFFFFPLFVGSIGGKESLVGIALGFSGIGTFAAIFLSKKLLKNCKAKMIAGFGGIFYALGATGFLFVHSVSILIFISMVCLGMGWGFYFNVAPYILSLFSSDKNRSMLFSYSSAFSVLGSGLAPILIQNLWGTHIHFNALFLTAVFSALASSIVFFLIRAETKKKFTVSEDAQIKPSVFAMIFNSNVKYPILMVFLGASIYTMMLNFQTTFANHIKMNYAIFYMIYACAVVVSRLLLGKALTNFNQYRLTILLLILMTFSISSFLLASYGLFFYVMSSALLGVSYGLVYPTIQAIAANLVEERYRSDILSYFSLFYFFGVYLFPPLGGFLIVYGGYWVLLVALSLLALLELILGIMLYQRVHK